ncbi:MAG: Omp28-related outer membrane protein [Bacteroidota bacterium]
MKIPLLISLFLFGLMLHLTAQNLVSTEPQPRNVVLEEYTGIHCQYCPEGHVISQSIQAANPGRVVVINIHQGSFATPSGTDPDYRTSFGDALAGQTGLTGYPSGTVNRHVFPGNTTTALNRSAWGVAANTVMGQISPVNVGIQSEYNAPTRTLTITVEAYYTASAVNPVNKLNIALIQDSIIGVQQNGSTWTTNYKHMRMLRHMITGQWGDTINNTSQGHLVTKTYTYVVPLSYTNIPCIVENCKIAAFISEDQQEILSGDVVKAIGGTNKYIGKISGPVPTVLPGTTGNITSFGFSVTSALDVTEPFQLTLTSTNLPVDWSANILYNAALCGNSTIAMLGSDSLTNVSIVVTPGTIPAVPEFVFKMKSVNNPEAPEKQVVVNVVANVTDLVVNGSGGAETFTYKKHYLNGLAFAGNTHTTYCSASLLSQAIAGNALTGVHNIYANIAWTFPALKDDEAIALMAFMDAGGNVMLGGQDVGWDIMSGAAGSNGDAITQNFYTNYLLANFVDDGSTANSQFTINATDPIFGNLTTSAVTCPYGTNNYPDQISPRSGAFSIFFYNNNTAKTAAVRGQTANFKSVYFGVGMEMIGDTNVRNQIVKRAHDWFYTMVGIDEPNMLSLGQVYPNPANISATITFAESHSQRSLQVSDLTGRLVATETIPANTTEYLLNTASFQEGTYLLKLSGAGCANGFQKLLILH